MSSSPTAESESEAEFKTKTFFTRALMLSKFIRIAIKTPKTWIQNGLKFLSNQLMFIAVAICAFLAVGSVIQHFRNNEIPITFFKEYKVEIDGRVQCCTPTRCHNVSHIGIDLLDDNIFYQDSFLNDTLTDENGLFYIIVKSKQLGIMRPYLQIHHLCNTGDSPSTTSQSYRISWYKIPPHHVVESHETYVYHLFPLSLNGEGFIESRWSHCTFGECNLKLDKATERRYMKIVKKNMYYAL